MVSPGILAVGIQIAIWALVLRLFSMITLSSDRRVDLASAFENYWKIYYDYKSRLLVEADQDGVTAAALDTFIRVTNEAFDNLLSLYPKVTVYQILFYFWIRPSKLFPEVEEKGRKTLVDLEATLNASFGMRH